MQNPHRGQSQVNPQRENGRREIANDVFRALMHARLSGAEMQVVMTVIDSTWGWDKQSAQISLTQFEEATGLSRQSVQIAIHKAEAKRLVVAERNGTRGTEYLFNKHYDTWLLGEARQPGHPSTRQAGHPSSARKPGHPSEPGLGNTTTLVATSQLGNQITPDWATKSPQSRQPDHPSTRQPREPTTEPVKKDLKERPKESSKERGLLFELWNTLGIVRHKQLTDKMGSTLKAALKIYSVEELGQAMRNYAEVLFSEEHYWSHRWTLDEFLRRGLEKFMDRDVALANYRIEKGGSDDRVSGRRGSETTERYSRQHSAAELRESLRRPRGSPG